MENLDEVNKSSPNQGVIGKLKEIILTKVFKFLTPIAINLFLNDFLKGLDKEEQVHKLEELSKRSKIEMYFIEVKRGTNLNLHHLYQENSSEKSEIDLQLESKNWKEHFMWWSLVIIEAEKQLNHKLSNYPEWFVQ